MRKMLVGMTMVVMVACDGGPRGALEEEPVPTQDERVMWNLPSRTQTVTVLSPETVEDPGLVVHEWGTFTSVQSSEGTTLDGMQYTDEYLPPFVYGRDRASFQNTKSMEALPEAVTQKLETPVIYFYNDAPIDVRVEVDFPEGVISEWYPNATAHGPAIGALDAIAKGTMTWDVALTQDAVEVPWVPEDDIWAPSREVPAAMNVSTTAGAAGEEHEKFIFYRGVGRFDLPLRINSDAGGTLTLENLSEERIPEIFLLHVAGDLASVTSLGALDPATPLTAAPSPKELPLDVYTDVAATEVERALIESGLYPDEARAMVDTWRHSYFQTPGLRVLYIVPRAWTDALLPIRVTPQPDALVRTLVGRVEVLRQHEEVELVEMLQDKPGLEALLEGPHGRFLEAKLRRAQELIEDPELDAHIESLIDGYADHHFMGWIDRTFPTP